MHNTYIAFDKEMRKDYTILMPNMLPMHFKLIGRVLKNHGYRAELLESSGRRIIDTGLKYVHNDACYPAICVIGQFIDALQSGVYDPHKTALILFQTGGGCRASNYISLLRKALIKSGFPYVPVIAFGLAGLEKHPGFQLTVPMLHQMMYAVLYADLLMSLVNQTKPYETEPGAAERLAAHWTEVLTDQMKQAKRISYRKVQKNYQTIIKDFSELPKTEKNKIRVGVVGEIFVKYSPLGNNHLEQLLVNEGAEVCMPGLLDFCLYCCYNSLMDRKLYGMHKLLYPLYRTAYRFLLKKQKDIIDLMRREGSFMPPTPFDHTVSLIQDYINIGVKMGEGWLLTAEMLELSESGVENIVCTQPFGCLPNHICGKGMMKKLKERNPNINIVAIDYDASATEVNQENRIKLMLMNAKENRALSDD